MGLGNITNYIVISYKTARVVRLTPSWSHREVDFRFANRNESLMNCIMLIIYLFISSENLEGLLMKCVL